MTPNFLVYPPIVITGIMDNLIQPILNFNLKKKNNGVTPFWQNESNLLVISGFEPFTIEKLLKNECAKKTAFSSVLWIY